MLKARRGHCRNLLMLLHLTATSEAAITSSAAAITTPAAAEAAVTTLAQIYFHPMASWGILRYAGKGAKLSLSSKVLIGKHWQAKQTGGIGNPSLQGQVALLWLSLY